jgi:hypothetical protein
MKYLDKIDELPELGKEEEYAIPVYNPFNAEVVNEGQLIRTPCKYFSNKKEAREYQEVQCKKNIEARIERLKDEIEQYEELLR